MSRQILGWKEVKCMDWASINLAELNTVTIIVRIFLAILIGGLIGLERGIKNKAAGFRTYLLVCVGAAMVMMTSQFVFDQYGNGDPTRMGAQVISGIGFLGAGTILGTRRSQITGLTTAAGLWTSACIGLAVGIGFYDGAIIGGVTVLLILTMLEGVKGKIQSNTKQIECYIIFESISSFNKLLKNDTHLNWTITNIQAEEFSTHSNHYVYNISFELNEPRYPSDAIKELMSFEGVLFAKEIVP